MKVKNKVILLSGGNGLIGSAIVKHLRQNEAIVLNLDLHHATDLEQGQIHCDITDTEAVNNSLKQVMERFGQIDGLVNCAYPRTKDWATPFEQISYTSWQKNVDMQLNTVFYLCQQVLKIMRQAGAGSIVNISSIYGVVGNDPTLYAGTPIVPPAAYSAIKGGLINFTRFLAAQYGRDGVRINCVSPGGIFDHQSPGFVAAYEKKVPAGRMGTPSDIAPSVTFLLSDEATYITGHNLLIDGGWTIV